MILGLVFAPVVAAFQQGGSAAPQAAMRIHAESGASSFVSAIAGLFVKELPPAWASSSIRLRVAHAEYEAVGNPAKLIPEQRIVDVWNQYVKEIGAPDEATVSVAEITTCAMGRIPLHS